MGRAEPLSQAKVHLGESAAHVGATRATRGRRGPDMSIVDSAVAERSVKQGGEGAPAWRSSISRRAAVTTDGYSRYWHTRTGLH
jgi:hypothetical protein